MRVLAMVVVGSAVLSACQTRESAPLHELRSDAPVAQAVWSFASGTERLVLVGEKVVTAHFYRATGAETKGALRAAGVVDLDIALLAIGDQQATFAFLQDGHPAQATVAVGSFANVPSGGLRLTLIAVSAGQATVRIDY